MNNRIKQGQVFIIAEAGVNHNGDIEIAKKLIDIASEAGVDAVKFQTFKAKRLVTKKAEKAKYQESNTKKDESQYDMLKKLELSFEDHIELLDYCSKKNILFLSTPFDLESVDLLEKVGIDLFKIGSGEITNMPLLKYISAKNKPIILSTGMSNLGEIQEAIDWIKEEGNEEIILLHCNTSYPTVYRDVNLKAMHTIKEAFKIPVGYSDHTIGIEVAIAAVAMGACVIEKHFTIDKKMDGPDHQASLEPHELKNMVKAIRNIEKALGSGIKKMTISEKENVNIARKSIVAKHPIKKNTIITEAMLDTKRPGTGIAPKYFYEVIGKKANIQIDADRIIKWEDLK